MRNLFGAEMAARELGSLSLHDALDLCVLLAELQPERFPRAAVRWHGRLEVEAQLLTLAESQLALSALVALGAGDKEAEGILRRLLRRPGRHSAGRSVEARSLRAWRGRPQRDGLRYRPTQTDPVPILRLLQIRARRA